jgi:hypothetical protein
MRTGPGKANDGGLKYDLTKPNEAFWGRARAYFASCERHGIYVWLQIFGEPYVEGSEQRWYINPFNSENNVNDIPGLPGGAGSGEEAFYDPDNAPLMAIQDALVRRLLDETAGRFGNIVYEIGNEINQDSVTSKAEAWQRHWVEFFQAYEEEHDVSLLLSNNTRRSLFDADAEGFDVVNHYGFDYLPARDSEPVRLARIISKRVREDFARYQKPIVNSRPCSDPDRTEYPDIVSPSEGRWLFWSYFMSGGHVVGFRTTVDSWKGGRAVETILESLHRFVDATPLADMAPADLVTKGEALCLAAPGACCAVYLPAGGRVTLRAPDLPEGASLRWYDPREGAWGDITSVPEGQVVRLEAPGPGDWALLIKAWTESK